MPQPDDRSPNSEDYKNYGTNPMVDTAKDNKSTFAIEGIRLGRRRFYWRQRL